MIYDNVVVEAVQASLYWDTDGAATAGAGYVLGSAAQVDPDAGQLLDDIRRQRHTGQSRIVDALSKLEALDPNLEFSDSVDMTYVALSPDVHRILTVERGWTADQYERWLTRSLGALLRPSRASEDDVRPRTRR